MGRPGQGGPDSSKRRHRLGRLHKNDDSHWKAGSGFTAGAFAFSKRDYILSTVILSEVKSLAA
jgi:hypothetical protein